MNYEKYSPHWQEQVREVADGVLGINYFGKSSEIAREPDTHLIVCIDDNQLLGFALGRLLPKSGLRDFLEHRVDFVPEGFDAADLAGAFGVIQSVAVAPEHRGKGIGTGLISRLHDILVGHGADKMIATFKQGPSSSRIEGAMQQIGFKYWLRLKTNFQERCDQGEFVCADRTEKCNCEAVFYRKTIY
ncbi:MAG: GNAT family N-acetyltransferase [Alphaproteobacteria bacterium]|nr:GNAT family N-acetyltransferase [Alphaproteobacteria bacterium]